MSAERAAGAERAVDCEVIRGTVFRPFLGQPLSRDGLENIVRALPGPPIVDLSRRWDEEEQVFCVDWRQGDFAYTAGLYKGELTFVKHPAYRRPCPGRRPGHCGPGPRMPWGAVAGPGLV